MKPRTNNRIKSRYLEVGDVVRILTPITRREYPGTYVVIEPSHNLPETLVLCRDEASGEVHRVSRGRAVFVRRPRQSRWYYGELISPCGPNSAGMRWSCLVDNAGWLKADTLAGIKSLIRDAKGVNSPNGDQG